MDAPGGFEYGSITYKFKQPHVVVRYTVSESGDGAVLISGRLKRMVIDFRGNFAIFKALNRASGRRATQTAKTFLSSI